ncbi:MAG: Dabb family protein [Pyrinomonadaceae bacterium]
MRKYNVLIHIVCWKYRPETTAAMREQHISMLRSLSAKIECIKTFDVGSDVLHLERSFDTGLVAGFKNAAALDA